MEKMKEITTSYNLLQSLTKTERAQHQQESAGGARSAAAAAVHGDPTTASSSCGSSPFGSPFGSQTQHFKGAYEYQRVVRSFSERYGYTHPNNFYNPTAGGADSSQFAANFDLKRARKFVLRAAFLYLAVAASATFLYNFILESDDWSGTESLSRHEHREEVHRLRDEIRKKLRNAEFDRQVEMEHQKAQRALEYAERVMKSPYSTPSGSPVFFPLIDDSLGTVFLKPQDPFGVVYFEPAAKESALSNTEHSRTVYVQVPGRSIPTPSN